MDEVAELLERFRSSSRAGRAGMIDELLLASPDRRAVGAIIEYAADPTELDSGRCAAFKDFQYNEPEHEDDRERLCAVALRVAASDPGDMARAYAVLALGPFVERPEVEAVLIALMTNTTEDSDVRSAAFQVLSGRGHERREALFRSLLSDSLLRDEIETHFVLAARRQKQRTEPGAGPNGGA